MTNIKRDKLEGCPYIYPDDDADLIIGKVFTRKNKHWGWYSVKRVPNGEKVIDYTDPNTFKTSKQLCFHFIIRRMRVNDTKWQMVDVWIPVREGRNPRDIKSFKRAMEVIDYVI